MALETDLLYRCVLFILNLCLLRFMAAKVPPAADQPPCEQPAAGFQATRLQHRLQIACLTDCVQILGTLGMSMPTDSTEYKTGSI